jgi:hypothetical protein
MAKEYTSAHRPLVRTHIYHMVGNLVDYLLSPESPERKYPVLINDTCGQKPGEKYILYNVEQCTDGRHLTRVSNVAKRSTIIEVWDYSLVNVDFLKCKGVIARHVPFTFSKAYLDTLRSYCNPFYDFGFVGDVNPRRRKLLDELCKKYKVRVLRKIFGKERDKELAKCKIILNIHYSDKYNVFEVFRCGPWLEIGVPVISEVSIDIDPRCISTTYPNFIKTAENAIKNI